MGNFLRLLSREGGGDSCCSSSSTWPKSDIFVDFEHSRPRSAEEEPLYFEAENILLEAEQVLRRLRNYKGASKEIREAIGSQNSPTSCALAWDAVLPCVRQLHDFYTFSKQLNQIVPKILLLLCAQRDGEAPANQHSIAERLDEHQALVKQFAKVLEFVLKFDECKMSTPAVQNDFSYYRRTIQRRTRMSIGGLDDAGGQPEAVEEPEIPLDVANCMSLFFAHATPMLNALSSAISEFVATTAVESSEVASNAMEMLSVMAKVCQKIITTPELRSRLQYHETELFILRVMVATIILYDHVHPTGAFAKGSTVDVKGCVKVLRDQERSKAESLVNALRYTTKHLNEEATPKSIKTLLFEEMT